MVFIYAHTIAIYCKGATLQSWVHDGTEMIFVRYLFIDVILILCIQGHGNFVILPGLQFVTQHGYS